VFHILLDSSIINGVKKTVMVVNKGYISFLIAIISLVITVGQGLAQEASSKSTEKALAPIPSVPEETFSGSLDTVWETLLDVLKGYDLPIASSDKSTGTITTATKRYFKILSAKFPPIQHDYRDTYTLKVIPAESSTKVQIQRKFEMYDNQSKNWVEGDSGKEKAGINVESLFETLKKRLAQAKSQ
jgi:hypothetical protein